METKRFKNWWFLALNGLIFLLFGILIVFFTPEVIKTLLRYFGIVMLGVGALLLLVGINNIRRDKSGMMVLVESFAGIAVGLALLIFPEASLSLFLILIGIWVILIGIVQLVVLVNLKQTVRNKNILLINGLLTIGLGVALLFNPFQWAVIVLKLIGVLAALFGILLVYFSFVLRSIKNVENPAEKVKVKD